MSPFAHLSTLKHLDTKQHKNMEKNRITYQEPSLVELELCTPQNLFVTLSVCGEVEDWDDGGEL